MWPKFFSDSDRINYSVNWKNAPFELPQISFLGYLVSGSDLEMDPEKVRAVLQWPLPTSLKAIQHFLGFANYYQRFIQGFSTIVSPITALTRKGANTKSWSPEALRAFQFLKNAFCSAPVLQQSETSRPFFLEVDASNIGIGATLP
ncbi:uncharacterized protein LOC142101839 [Mixophyes fleayi]|uniref:uncharacterized protein LOC142101839 n=1 Tax=Mixophyes fleayi TaxID=3061075 RepID=UPI003F4E0BD5